MLARGVRSGALRQMVCVSAYLCAHRLLCVNAVRKEEEEEEEGTVLAGGRKSNEKFSQVAQETEFVAVQKAVETYWTESKTGENGYIKATFL